MSDKLSVPQIDITEAAQELVVHSPGSLEQLDQEKKISHKWLRKNAILYLSIIVIMIGIIASISLIWFSDEAQDKDWGKTVMSLLIGYAAGSIWKSSSKENE